MKTSQKIRLLKLLSDGKPHRTDNILQEVYGSEHLGLARVGARIWDLKQAGKNIVGWKDENKQLYWYQLKIN